MPAGEVTRRPFAVTAADCSVVVLGTRFADIHDYAGLRRLPEFRRRSP